MWNGQILIVLLNLGTLAYGGHLAMHNCLSIANFVAFILYQQRLGDVLDVGSRSFDAHRHLVRSSQSTACTLA